MDIDTEKVDEAVLAVPYLTLHEHVRAWKGIDWEAMAPLHKRLIEDSVGTQKSVVFTDEGLRKAARCFDKLLAGSWCMSLPITDLPEGMPDPAFNRTVLGAASPAGAAGHLSR